MSFGDTAERLVNYLMFLGPVVYLALAVRAYAKDHPENLPSRSRRYSTILGLAVLTISTASLLMFPDVVPLIGGPDEPAGHMSSVVVGFGFLTSVGGAIISLFAVPKTRFLAVTAAYVLVILWLLCASGL